MSFFITYNLFVGKVSLDVKMGFSFLENKCHRISEISVLLSLSAKLLITV